MKYLIILIFITGMSASCFKKMAQRESMDPEDKLIMLKKAYPDSIINRLKLTTTVFFTKNETKSTIDSIQTALNSIWNLTPLIFDDISNFEEYASNPKYSYFIIEGVNTKTTGDLSYDNTHYYLTLRIFKEISKKGVIKTIGLSRMELYPNFKTMQIGTKNYSPDFIISKLYDAGVFYNWTPILLKAKLASTEENLNLKVRPWHYQDVKNEKLSEILANDTLYVPRRLLNKYKPTTGAEINNLDHIFINYKYPFRICDDSELYKIFEEEKRGRLLFEYVKSSTDKFVSIYDLKLKSLIYKKYKPISYNLEGKDLSSIK